MEAHPRLQCLAWPMHAFFDSKRPERSERVRKIVQNLSRTLVELRVDAMYDASGEFMTDKGDPHMTSKY